MNIVFAGTSEAAKDTLKVLHALHTVSLVLTRVDAPVGRRKVFTPSPVAELADELGLDVYKANKLDEAAVQRISDAQPDLGVIVAYGALIREPLLSKPKHGWINLHFSLLPKWRGAAPVQRALMAQDKHMGVSIFSLVKELDAGDVYLRKAFDDDGQSTAREIISFLAEKGADLMAQVVGEIERGTALAYPQEGDLTYAEKMVNLDGKLEFGESCDRVYARFRGVTDEPGAYGIIEGKRYKIHACAPAINNDWHLQPGQILAREKKLYVGTATEPLELFEIQPEGKKVMSALQWWTGVSDELSFDVENPSQISNKQ